MSSFIFPFLHGSADDGKTINPDKCPELTGRVVHAQDPFYDKARLVSNYYASKNKFPDTIVYCRNVQDVQHAILWAKCQKLSVRIRSGGHNHEGFSTGNKAVVIDVSEMKGATIDKARGLATIQPGVTGGELYAILFKEGFTQAGGTCKDVGLSGLVLTGGMGPLLRIHGLTCDTLISFDIVDANGQLLHATKDNEHKDLFWACCGGGAGNFGVLTSIVLRIYPAKPVTWFNIGWDWDQPVEKIIATWQDLFLEADKKWFSHLDLWAKAFPSEKLKKQPIKVLGVFYGSPEEAKQSLAPFLRIGRPDNQTIEWVSWEKAIRSFEEATSVFLTDKPEYKSTGAFAMNPLPPEAIKTIVNTLQNTKSPLLNVLLFSLGGAIQDKQPTDTAYFYRDAKFFLCYSSQWLQEKDDIRQIQEVDALRQSLAPYTQGDYVGNPDRSLKDYLTTYYGENVARLQIVKRKYDPQNLFQYEQSVTVGTKE
jgi:FAD/FMN-containing dehydrogenase